jgi:hypothetical protein
MKLKRIRPEMSSVETTVARTIRDPLFPTRGFYLLREPLPCSGTSSETSAEQEGVAIALVAHRGWGARRHRQRQSRHDPEMGAGASVAARVTGIEREDGAAQTEHDCVRLHCRSPSSTLVSLGLHRCASGAVRGDNVYEHDQQERPDDRDNYFASQSKAGEIE